MKKIVGCFVCLLTTIAYSGPVVDMLHNKSVELLNQKKAIAAKKTELSSNVYQLLKNNLIDKLADSIENTVGGFIKTVDGVKAQIKDYVPYLGIAGVGDLPAALDGIKLLLQQTERVLKTVQGRFVPIVASLNQVTDPKAIYSNMDKAMGEMDVAYKQMETMQRFVEQLGL